MRGTGTSHCRTISRRIRPSIIPEEYARGDVTTNRVEGYFSVLKRGITGIYQRVSEEHLKRYLWEFDFRHSNRIALGCDDVTRADRALVGAKGKRLTYVTTHERR